ncbi:MAG TPA: tyrosine-protein phosphatase [Phycisphaerae bacterium]|nr:tyrosine-protein phosphatase [Phycisphaerae bacterium]
MTDRRRGSRAALGAAVLAAVACAGFYVYHRLSTNFHTVVPGEVYRAAQPGGWALDRWVGRYGLKTVINLRGDGPGRVLDGERRAAERLGIRMANVRLSADHTPSALELKKLVVLLDTVERPILLHCRAGADRTGLASVMAAMAVGGQGYTAARGQMSLLYLHLGDDPEQIEGVLHQYEAWCRRNGLDTDGWPRFRQWAMSEYHRAYYRVHIDAPQTLTAQPGEDLAVAVTVTNRSGRPIPAGRPGRLFALAVFIGSSLKDSPERELGPRTPLPRRSIAPGESVTLTQRLTVPQAAGTYAIHFDLVDDHVSWFGRQGSPVADCELLVEPAPATAPVP